MFVVNFDALERRHAVFPCWMQDSKLGRLRHQLANRMNARWQTDWAIEDQPKNLNSTARPYDQRAFSPLDPNAIWLSHLALAIHTCMHTYMYTHIHTFIHTCMSVVILMFCNRQVDFESKRDKLSTSAECRIRTQSLWIRISSRLDAHWKTDQAIEDQQKLELNSTSLWWVSIKPTRPHCQLAFAGKLTEIWTNAPRFIRSISPGWNLVYFIDNCLQKLVSVINHCNEIDIFIPFLPDKTLVEHCLCLCGYRRSVPLELGWGNPGKRRSSPHGTLTHSSYSVILYISYQYTHSGVVFVSILLFLCFWRIFYPFTHTIYDCSLLRGNPKLSQAPEK